jgi:arabinogalactan endo-1,4-beta-galactosidase
VTQEAGGHSGQFRLSQRGSSGPFQARTAQTLAGLADGWYTLRAWARTSSGAATAAIGLQDCGGPDQQTAVPVAPQESWLEVTVSAEVKGGRCTVVLLTSAGAADWASFDDVTFGPGRAQLSLLGADLSSLKKSIDKGGVYADEQGTPGDALKILAAHGLNAVRLRVWVDPPDGYHDKAELLDMARRVKAQSLHLLVDFHYSDTWADPGKQPKPAAWQALPFAQLKQALYDHTFDVCQGLKAQGTPPDMVQIGNEINDGLLWPDGRATNWDNLAALLTAGYQAVKACSPDTRVMLHLAEGGNNSFARGWFDAAAARHVPYDLIGVSYYPYWHGTLADLQNNLNDLAARYDKDVVVAETAYPFTSQDKDGTGNIISTNPVPGYDFSPAGQQRLLADVMSIVRAVPNGRGLGIYYWEPAWTAVTGNGWDPADSASGNGWENQALFDFNNRALPAMRAFGQP